MNRRLALLIILILSACQPSEAAIETAIEQTMQAQTAAARTQAAAPETSAETAGTVEPTQKASASPTATPSAIPEPSVPVLNLENIGEMRRIGELGVRLGGTSLGWSLDGSQLAFGGISRMVHVYELGRWEQALIELSGPRNYIESFTQSADGERWMVTSRDGTLRTYDAVTGEQLEVLEGVVEVTRGGFSGRDVWSPDQGWLASADFSENVRIVDTATGEVLRTLTASGRVYNLDLSPDGDTLAAILRDGTIVLWDVETGEIVTEFGTQAGDSFLGLDWSPTGDQIAASVGKWLYIYYPDGEFAEATELPFEDNIMVVRWSPDGSMLAVGGSFDDPRMGIVDLSSGELVYSSERFENRVFDLSWSPDGSYLAVAVNKAVLLFGLADPAPVGAEGEERQEPGGESAPASDMDAPIVFASTNFDLYLVYPDGSGLRQLTSGPFVDSEPRWSPDGSRIAFVRDGSIYTISPDGEDLLQVTDDEGQDRSPTWSPEGDAIAFVSDRGTNAADLWVIDHTGTYLVVLVQTARGVASPAWSPDGDTLVYIEGGFFYEMDTTTWMRDIFYEDSNLPSGLDWSPDGHFLAYLSRRSGDPEIYTITPEGDSLTRITSSPNFDQAPSWSPSGDSLVFASVRTGDLRLYIIDLQTGETTPLLPDMYGTSPDWAPVAVP